MGQQKGRHRTFWTNEQHSHWNIPDSQPEYYTAILAENFRDVCQIPSENSGIIPKRSPRSRVSKYIPVPFLINQRIIRHYVIWATKRVIKQITDKLAALRVNRKNSLPLRFCWLNCKQCDIFILTVSWQRMTNQIGKSNFCTVFLDMTTCSLEHNHNTNFALKTLPTK